MSFYQNFLKPLALDVKGFVVDTLFPITCVCCGKEYQFICDACASTFARAQQMCIICGKPSPGGATHPGCRTPQSADGLVAIFDYHDENVSRAIIQGKYSFLPGVYHCLGTLVTKIVAADHPYLFSLSASITPVPLSAMRRRWRGFNQAEILAAEISRSGNIPVLNCLQRTRNTKTQKDLKKDERTTNVSGCFALTQGEDIRGNTILLVDDVVTTGSTIGEAAKVLKRNGATSVWCLAVAKD